MSILQVIQPRTGTSWRYMPGSTYFTTYRRKALLRTSALVPMKSNMDHSDICIYARQTARTLQIRYDSFYHYHSYCSNTTNLASPIGPQDPCFWAHWWSHCPAWWTASAETQGHWWQWSRWHQWPWGHQKHWRIISGPYLSQFSSTPYEFHWCGGSKQLIAHFWPISEEIFDIHQWIPSCPQHTIAWWDDVVEAGSSGQGQFKFFDFPVVLIELHFLQLQEYCYLKVHYKSVVDWKLATNYLRCSPSFHGHERCDWALIRTHDKDSNTKNIFAQILFMFKYTVGDQHLDLALVLPMDAPIGPQLAIDQDLRFTWLHAQPAASSEFLSIYSIICGALLVPDYANPHQDFFLVDVVDSDMFLHSQKNALI